MRKLLIILAILTYQIGFSQKVVTYSNKVATYNNKIVTYEVYSPTTLDPTCWYETYDTTQLTIASGTVSQWNDLSQNAYHLLQPTGTNQPTWVSPNIVRFDGGNDFLSRDFGVTLTQPFTVIVVYSNTQPSAADRYIHDAYSTTNRVVTGYSSTGNIFLFAGGAFVGYAKTLPYSIIGIYEYNGASSKLYENNLLKATVNASNSNFNPITLGSGPGGSGNFLKGDIRAFIVVPKILTDSERNNLYNYLNERY